MIKTLKVSGLGVHGSAEFTFGSGWTKIRGPSKSGKTTIASAITFAFHGEDIHGRPMPSEMVRAGERIDTEVVFESGTSFRRTMTEKRSQTLWQNDRSVKASEWSEVVGGIADKGLVRAVMLPLEWTKLTGAPGAGKHLRDLLIEAAGVDVDSVLSDLLPGEPRDEAGAEKDRATKNRNALEAAGALREATAALVEAEALTAASGTRESVDSSRAIVAAGAAWAAYWPAKNEHVRAVESAARAQTALEGWRRDLKALGKRPTTAAEGSGVEAARLAREEAAETLRGLESDATYAHGAIRACAPPMLGRPDAEDASYQATRAEYAAAKIAWDALPEDGTCPTCRADWPDAVAEKAKKSAALVKIAAEGKAAKEAKEAAEKRIAEEHAEAMDAHRARLSDLTAKAAAADANVAEAMLAYKRAAAAADTAADLVSDPAAAWDARSAALGAEPKVPAIPACPAEPNVHEPSDEAIAVAAAAVHAAEVAAAAARMTASSLDAARKRVELATLREADAKAKAERAEAVVEIIRTAPVRLAADVREEIGDIGPVSFSFEGTGATVLIGGLPWWLASRGELGVADLYFRAGIRKASCFEWLPLIVDNAQDWSGEWPAEIEGPVWQFFTERIPAIVVEISE